ncbi:FtsX-like permease family protein [Halosegnis longus]|uniref:FtsX-like permease family protein n=1 Tax=Halosegnis longus TaxID=2216012 RepID=UPI0013562B7A|nr:FtsX-like permease family protein [Salella cibi]
MIGVMLTVTSITVGFVATGVGSGQSTDYVVTPGDNAGSLVTEVGGQRFGHVHAATTRFEQTDGVRWATPVLVQPVAVAVGDDREYILLVGIIPAPEMTVTGLPAEELTAGDPFHDGGTRTGEAIMSTAAADTLEVSRGQSFQTVTGPASANRTFRATAIESPQQPGLSQFPVALVHLSELQALTGATDGDVADRFLIAGSGGDLAERLGGVYPQATVQTQGALLEQRVLDSQLVLAVGIGAFVVTVLLGGLFIATTMGLQLAAEARDRAVLRAIGLSRTSRFIMTGVRIITVCLLGWVGGTVLWVGGVVMINTAAGSLIQAGTVARADPRIPLLGLLAAVLIGLVVSPYVLYVSRTTPMEQLQ